MSSNHIRKICFSNLSYKTTENVLLTYFSYYGLIDQLYLCRDDQNQSLRKGYVVFKDMSSVDNLMYKRPHIIDDREIRVNRAMPKQNQQRTNISESLGINLTVNEIFIGRVSSSDQRETFINYFKSFGNIIDCRVIKSYGQYSKQTGYAFIRFSDYDSVDRIILSRPHTINSKFYYVRKSIPREFNYIISSVKPLSQNRPIWNYFSMGLINMKTQEIISPSSLDYLYHETSKFPLNEFTLINKSPLTISVEKMQPEINSTGEFEVIHNQSLSSSSLSLDDFTPVASPLYSTALAYSPNDKHIYDLI